MWNTDNINIELGIKIYPDRAGTERLRQYTTWLKERNIKYSLVRIPEWATHPSAINLRKEDALLFKLTFGL